MSNVVFISVIAVTYITTAYVSLLAGLYIAERRRMRKEQIERIDRQWNEILKNLSKEMGSYKSV